MVTTLPKLWVKPILRSSLSLLDILRTILRCPRSFVDDCTIPYEPNLFVGYFVLFDQAEFERQLEKEYPTELEATDVECLSDVDLNVPPGPRTHGQAEAEINGIHIEAKCSRKDVIFPAKDTEVSAGGGKSYQQIYALTQLLYYGEQLKTVLETPTENVFYVFYNADVMTTAHVEFQARATMWLRHFNPHGFGVDLYGEMWQEFTKNANCKTLNYWALWQIFIPRFMSELGDFSKKLMLLRNLLEKLRKLVTELLLLKQRKLCSDPEYRFTKWYGCHSPHCVSPALSFDTSLFDAEEQANINRSWQLVHLPIWDVNDAYNAENNGRYVVSRNPIRRINGVRFFHTKRQKVA